MLIRLYESAAQQAFDLKSNEPEQIIENVEQTHLALTQAQCSEAISIQSAVLSAVEMAEKAYSSKSGITGVPTGFEDLDRKLGGLQNSDLIVLGGRPSMGKTALAVNIAVNAAKYYESANEEKSVLFFTLEMSKDQLANRILSASTGIPVASIHRGDMKQDQFRTYVEATQAISELPLYIDDRFHIDSRAAFPVKTLVKRARRHCKNHNTGLIVIDYLHLMQSTGSAQADQNRTVEISEITRALQWLARDLNIPVLVVSQLSRALEQREDKRPQLSDLRDSGSIEHDADVVLFLYREEYYLLRHEPQRHVGETQEKFHNRYNGWHENLAQQHNIAELIIAKHRHGPIGSIKLHFDAECTRFGNLG